jgi:hypothetical protein
VKTFKMLIVALAMTSLAGCWYHEVRPYRPACPYGSYWVGRFRDGAGYWHEGHWQCR